MELEVQKNNNNTVVILKVEDSSNACMYFQCTHHSMRVISRAQQQFELIYIKLFANSFPF
jgi:hypothetical protein